MDTDRADLTQEQEQGRDQLVGRMFEAGLGAIDLARAPVPRGSAPRKLELVEEKRSNTECCSSLIGLLEVLKEHLSRATNPAPSRPYCHPRYRRGGRTKALSASRGRGEVCV